MSSVAESSALLNALPSPKPIAIGRVIVDPPVLQAPMAGSATPALAAAVGNAGGLGSLGCAAMTLEVLERNAFELRAMFYYDEAIPFSRETWRGRMRALRGIGASLSQEQVENFARMKALIEERGTA